MRIILRTLISSNIFIARNRFQNFTRRLTQQQVTFPKKGTETLTGRIFQYLNTDKDNRSNALESTFELLSNFRQNQKELCKLSNKEIVNFANVLNEKIVADDELLLILKELDIECCNRLSKFAPADTLRLLNGYMCLVPNRITEFKFYKYAVSALFNSVHHLNKKDLLQLMFYIGLKKKSSERQTQLRECLKFMNNDFIDSLTSEELCIICNSTFKTSTKIINQRLLEKVRMYINNNLLVLKDVALLVTLIKSLRHNRYQNDDLLNTISCGILFNKTYVSYSFPISCHIMALFADYFFYDEMLMKLLTKQCVEQLNESNFLSKKLHPTNQLRGKDIKRFLWILSMFSEIKLIDNNDIKTVVIPKLIERIKAGEFESDFDSLCDITLYLWMLNYRAYELVPYVFNKGTPRLLAVNSKTNLRLNLLLQAIYTEDPELSEQLPITPADMPSDIYSTYQLHKRPLIQRLVNTLNGIRNEVQLNKFELSQEIPHLNIIGITGYRNEVNKAVYIEVLDDYTKIKNVKDDIPVGLMALKLRLLDKSEEGVLVVSQKETEEMTDPELREYLLDEIKLIC